MHPSVHKAAGAGVEVLCTEMTLIWGCVRHRGYKGH